MIYFRERDRCDNDTEGIIFHQHHCVDHHIPVISNTQLRPKERRSPIKKRLTENDVQSRLKTLGVGNLAKVTSPRLIVIIIHVRIRCPQ